MKARLAGFTLIEVMVSLGVMTIGAMATLAMLSHIVRANGQTRQINTAMAITASLGDHIKEDAHRWIQAAAESGAPTPQTVLANTLYLRFVPANPSAAFAEFPATGAVVSRAHDYQGRAVALPSGAFFYCSAYRMSWIYFGHAIRVDFRTFWPRTGAGVAAPSIVDDFQNCAGPNQAELDPGGDLADRYHVVYSSVSVGVTPVIR